MNKDAENWNLGTINYWKTRRKVKRRFIKL